MAELVEILHTVYVMEGIQSAMVMATTHARQIFSDLDEDRNGCITLEEFVEGCMNDMVLISYIPKEGEVHEETSCEDTSLPKEQQNAP